MTDHSTWAKPLVAQLMKLADPDNPNRAAMAHLRRGLGNSPDYTLARVGWFFRGIPDEREERALNCAILAAGLFAWVKGVCPQSGNVNFGRAFGSGLTEDGKAQREKRFIDLLDTDSEELPYKLRQAITLIAGDSVGLDWVKFILDLIHWDHPERWVQKAWARGFWSSPLAETESTEVTVASN
jgi:CRISPR system Cascade subunit CasB